MFPHDKRISAVLLLFFTAALIIAAIVTTGQRAAAQPSGTQQLGDANCDGSVNAVDATIILQFDAGLLTALPCATASDVNNDGRVNSIDASFVLQFTAGLIDRFVRCDVTADPSNVDATISAALSGTTICLDQGLYSNVTVNRKSNLEIVGTGTNTIVDDRPGSNGCVFVFDSSDIRISGLATRNCQERGVFVASSTDITIDRVETQGGPVGFHYVNSSGTIEDARAQNHYRESPPGFGVLLNQGSDVTVKESRVLENNIGMLARDNSTLRVEESVVSDNDSVGIITMAGFGSTERASTTSIEDSTVTRNNLGIFAGVPGCAPLPAADPTAPTCYLSAPDEYVSDIGIEIVDSKINANTGTGVVFFPGVSATLSDSEVSGNGLTGLFAWGASVNGTRNEYAENVENAIECRAYPGPEPGEPGMCEFTNEYIHNSLPFGGNALGGGFVSEGAEFRLSSSRIEANWGIGVSVHHMGKGEIVGNTIADNGGTAFCISAATWIVQRDNTLRGNRAGECLGHP